MWINLNSQRTPDGADGGGTTPSTPAAAPAAAPGPQPGASSATPPSPKAGGVDQQAYDRALQQQAEHTRLWQGLNAQGIKSQDDLNRAIETAKRFAPLANDPRSKGVLEALTAPPPQPDLSQQPVTLATVGAVFDDRLRSFNAEQMKQSQQRAHENALRTEASLVDSAMTDPRFAQITGGKSFEDALAGNAGPGARMMALYIDNLVVAQTMGQDGRRSPLTDPTLMKTIVDKAYGDMKGIFAEQLLRAAPGANGAPGDQRQQGGGPPAAPNGAVVGGTVATPGDLRARERAAVNSIFREQLARQG